MATVTGDTLPPLLMERLNPHFALRTSHFALLQSTAIPICTIDPDGLPHPAMLSYAELAADDEAAWQGHRLVPDMGRSNWMPLVMTAAGSRVVSTASAITATTVRGNTAMPGEVGCGVSGPVTMAFT